MRRMLISISLLACVVPAHGQIFGGITFDPTVNSSVLGSKVAEVAQAVKVVENGQQQIQQWKDAMQMWSNPRGYLLQFPGWRQLTLLRDTYGHATAWQQAANQGGTVISAYNYATTPIVANPDYGTMAPDQQWRLAARYASLNLRDGSSLTSLGQIGDLRASIAAIENQIANLQSDSLTTDSGLSSQLQVAQKTNAAALATAQITSDQEKIALSNLEMQLIAATEHRNAIANSLWVEANGGSVQAAETVNSLSGLGSTISSFVPR